MSQSHSKPDSNHQQSAWFRFGLLEVILLVTASAVALWSYDYTMIFHTDLVPDSNTWRIIFRCNYFVASAVSLTGLLLLIQSLVMRRKIFVHPGHIFFYYCGLSAVVAILASFYVGYPKGNSYVEILGAGLPFAQIVDLVGRVWNVMIANCVFAILFYVFAAIKFRGRWRFAFSGLVAHTILSLCLAMLFRFSFVRIIRRDPDITQLVAYLSSAIDILALCLILFVAFCCVIDRKRRDWKHWLGIALLVHGCYATRALTYVAQVLGA